METEPTPPKPRRKHRKKVTAPSESTPPQEPLENFRTPGTPAYPSPHDPTLARSTEQQRENRKIDLEHLERLAAAGLTRRQIWTALRATEEQWLRWERFKIVKQALKRGTLEATKHVEASLYRIATGYDFEEVTKDQKLDKDGTRHTLEKRTIKHVAPNVIAASIYLTNMAPDRWKVQNALGQEQGGRPVEVKELAGMKLADLLSLAKELRERLDKQRENSPARGQIASSASGGKKPETPERSPENPESEGADFSETIENTTPNANEPPAGDNLADGPGAPLDEGATDTRRDTDAPPTADRQPEDHPDASEHPAPEAS
jgi:hypothetical protein